MATDLETSGSSMLVLTELCANSEFFVGLTNSDKVILRMRELVMNATSALDNCNDGLFKETQDEMQALRLMFPDEYAISFPEL